MTTDRIYENFKQASNFELAYTYIKSEFRDSSLALDPIWSPAVTSIENYKDKFLSTLIELLENYQPENAEFFYAHKDNLSTRKIAVLSVTDRLVYQALLNNKALGASLSAKFLKCSYSPRISKKDKKYLDSYKSYWEQFIKAQINAFNKGYVFYAEFDVERFFDNVNHQVLKTIITSEYGISTKALNLLMHQLSTWFPKGKGLPQGPDASFTLSNVYLSELDMIYEKNYTAEVRYFRYNDDFVIMSKTENDLHALIEKLTYKLIDLDLSINNKTRLRKLQSDEDLKDKLFTNPYEDYIEPTVADKITKIEAELPFIFEKIKNFQEIEKKEYSSLKYFLKATGRCSPEYFYDFLDMLPSIPSLTPLICKYLSYYYHPNHYFDFSLWLSIKYNESYFYRWPKFWIIKLLLRLADYYNDDDPPQVLDTILSQKDVLGFEKEDFLNELVVNNDWVFNSLGIFILTNKQPTETNKDKLLQLIRNCPNNYAKALYLGSITGFSEEYITEYFEDYLRDCLREPSIDVQIIALNILQQSKGEFDLLPDTAEFTQRFFKVWDPEENDSVEKTVSAVTINFNGNTTINLVERLGFDNSDTENYVSGTKSKKLVCGDLTLDTEEGTLIYKNEKIEINPSTRESKFLEILLSNSPKIVGYAAILRFVYSHDMQSSEYYKDAKDAEADIKKVVQDLRRNLYAYLLKNFKSKSNTESLLSMIKPKHRHGYKISSD